MVVVVFIVVFAVVVVSLIVVKVVVDVVVVEVVIASDVEGGFSGAVPSEDCGVCTVVEVINATAVVVGASTSSSSTGGRVVEVAEGSGSVTEVPPQPEIRKIPIRQPNNVNTRLLVRRIFSDYLPLKETYASKRFNLSNL